MTLVLSEPWAAIPFWTTVVVWGIGERLLSFRDLRSGAWKSRQDAGSVFAVAGGVIGGILAGVGLASGRAMSLPFPILWLCTGLAMAWAGILLRLWAVLTLGRSFTTTVVVKPGQIVVTGGPYRFVRHPSYLGLLIMFLGLGLALGNLASAAAMVALPSVGLLWRIRVEEAALRAGLGDSYVAYCAGRARLIPGIW